MPGDVEIETGRIAAVGCQPAGAGGLAVPGFVDLQVNGFGGVDFLSADGADYAAAGDALAATGVTAFQPTLISAPPAALRTALAVASEARCPLRVLGVHLEGPFLSPAWPGAHQPEHLRAPDPAAGERLDQVEPTRQLWRQRHGRHRAGRQQLVEQRWVGGA